MYAAVKKVMREQERRERLEFELERQRLEKILQLQQELKSLSLQSSDVSQQDSDVDSQTPIIAVPRLGRRRLERQKSAVVGAGQDFGSIDIGILSLTRFRPQRNRTTGGALGRAGRSTSVSIEEPSSSTRIIPEDCRQDPTSSESRNTAEIPSTPTAISEKGQDPLRPERSRVLLTLGVAVTCLGLIIVALGYALRENGIHSSHLLLLMGGGGLVSAVGIGLILFGINVSIFPGFLRCSSCPRLPPPSSPIVIDPEEIPANNPTSSPSQIPKPVEFI